jgi:hypothetical protein
LLQPLVLYWMKSIDVMRKAIISLALILFSCCAFASPNDEVIEKIIEQGRKELFKLQGQNAINDADGKSYLNHYLVMVALDDVEYPDGSYITQKKGIGSGSQADYILDRNSLENLDSRLRTMNATSEIDAYLLVVNYMPIEFVNEIPDDVNILQFFSGRRTDAVAVVADTVLSLAKGIVEGITDNALTKVTKPTLYCGFVNFRIFKNARNAYQQWVYYPNNSKIKFNVQYQNLLNGLVRNFTWPQENSAKISSLVNLIDQNNTAFKQLQGTLESLTTITDPDKMRDIIHATGNSGLAAFDLRQRVHAMKVLCGASLGNSREIQVLNLLRTAPASDYTKLLDSLMTANKFSSGEESLLTCIVGKTEDEHLFWGDDNYLELMKTIGHIAKNASNIDSKTGNLVGDPESNKIMVWDKSYALNFLANLPVGTNSYSVDLLDNGYLYFTHQYVADLTCETYIQGMTAKSYERCDEVWSDQTENVINPFELIGFVNRSDLGILSGVGDKDAKIVVVPAIMLKYAQDKKINNNSATAFFMTLDVVTILVPFTKVYNLAKITQRIYLGLDLAAAAGSTANLGVNVFNGDTALAKVVAKYNLIMGVVNLAAIAGGTRVAATLAGEFVTEVNQPGVRKVLTDLAENGNKQADEILALEAELQAQGRATGQSWAASIATAVEASIDVTDDAIKLASSELELVKSYLLKSASARPSGVIDVVVHGSDDTYVLLVNGVEHAVDHRALATWLTKNGYSKNTIRLLSCSSLESAQDLANKLGQKVIATEDAVRVYAGGGVASTANNPWYELVPGNGLKKVTPSPIAPTNAQESFVELGTNVAKGADDLASALKQFDVAGEFAKGKNVVEFSIEWGGGSYKLTWSKINGKIDFGDRSQLARILGTSNDIEAHHLISWTKGGQHRVVQSAADDGFHLNMVENGLGLKKYTKLTGEGLHGNHPAYDDFLTYKLDEFAKGKSEFTAREANDFLQKQLIPEVKTHINNAGNTQLNLNEYFKQIINKNTGVPGY